jgi:hypothetical protein
MAKISAGWLDSLLADDSRVRFHAWWDDVCECVSAGLPNSGQALHVRGAVGSGKTILSYALAKALGDPQEPGAFTLRNLDNGIWLTLAAGVPLVRVDTYWGGRTLGHRELRTLKHLTQPSARVRIGKKGSSDCEIPWGSRIVIESCDTEAAALGIPPESCVVCKMRGPGPVAPERYQQFMMALKA